MIDTLSLHMANKQEQTSFYKNIGHIICDTCAYKLHIYDTVIPHQNSKHVSIQSCCICKSPTMSCIRVAHLPNWDYYSAPGLLCHEATPIVEAMDKHGGFYTTLQPNFDTSLFKVFNIPHATLVSLQSIESKCLDNIKIIQSIKNSAIDSLDSDTLSYLKARIDNIKQRVNNLEHKVLFNEVHQLAKIAKYHKIPEE